MPKPGKTIREKVMDWATEKLGNPMMPSREKQAIEEMDQEDEKARQKQMDEMKDQENQPSRTDMMHTMQMRGEDYPARYHKRRA